MERDDHPLSDMINNGYSGLSDSTTVNTREAMPFLVSQFERFNMRVPDVSIIEGAFTDVFRILDCFDPYVWFTLTDVVVTAEWQYNTFEVINMDGSIEEVSPEGMDHFRFIKGNEQENFDSMYNSPGLKHPNMEYILHYIEEILDETCQEYSENILTKYGVEAEEWFCTAAPEDVEIPRFSKELFKASKQEESFTHIQQSDGSFQRVSEGLRQKFEYLTISQINEILKGNAIEGLTPLNDLFSLDIKPLAEALVYNWKNHQAKLDYVRLGIWASFLWLISPMAKDFRRDVHPIFEEVYSNGECLFVYGNVVPKKNYNIIARSPASCIKCGINGWCVTQVNVMGVNRHMCEHHVNGEMLKVPPLNCGTLFCKATECMHHPYKGLKDAKLLVHREGGAISQRQQSRAVSLGYRPTRGFLN